MTSKGDNPFTTGSLPEHSIEADTSAYRIVRTSAACTFSSVNPTHDMVVDYAPTGFTIFPGTDRNGPHISFQFEGLGRNGGVMRPEPLSGQRADGGALEVELGTVRLRYHNDARGMRHDVVVHDRPDGDGRLEAHFRLEGGLPAMQTGPDEVVFHRFDEQAVTLVPAMRYSGLKAWDAQGRVLPSTMELHDDDLVLAVVDEDAQYPITIDPISTTADLEITGTQAGESLGYSVATAGDVNGDGYSDVLVGSPFWNTPFTNAGRVQLFLGSATGIPTTPIWTYQGMQVNDSLGFSVSSAGDINGDGYSDVAIGAPGRNGRGAVLVFVSNGSGMDTSPTYTLNGNAQNGCRFGWSVALAGDVNGDGHSDLLVGAPRYNTSSTAQGKAYCYHGGTSSLNLAWQVAGTATNAQFGFSVAGAGDLNGDGYSDAVIGEPFRTKAPVAFNSGALHLFSGNSGTGLSATGTMLQPGAGNYNVGYSISSAGDMDGDGYADIVVGAPGAVSGSGYIYVFRGASLSTLVHTSPAASLAGTATERLGHSVALAGDVNGDGFADIVVGSPGSSSNNGKAQVFRGAATVALDPDHRLWTRSGPTGTGRLGAAVCTGGDVNGDGISDLLVAAPDLGGTGSVRLFHGAPDLPPVYPTSHMFANHGMPNWSIAGGSANQLLGSCVATAGDVNGDGYSDVLVSGRGSISSTGRVMLFLGSASGLSVTPAWSVSGENNTDLFGNSVATAGDVNGDGYSDVLVGAPAFNGWRGKAYLYLGTAGGLSATPAWTRVGAAVEDRIGWGLSSAGDVNGDGYSDVVIGGYMHNDGQGMAQVFHGSASGLPATPNSTVLGSEQSFFGLDVSQAGDVNGDGYDDVIIGSPYWDLLPAGHNFGAAFVYHGSPGGISTTPAWSAFGEEAGDEFGSDVSYAGDVNGDGYSDVVIGAHRHNVSSLTSAGRAYIYHGGPSGGLATVPATVISGTQMNALTGFSVCAAGDVNGDGYGDVVIGSESFSWFAAGSGRADLHLGSLSGIAASSAWAMLGPSANAKAGNSVALAGDVNGDGFSDLVVGASQQTATAAQEGGAFLYLGNAGRSLPMRTYQYRSDLITPVRTSNGTFQTDCEWGIGQFARSSMGRSKVRLAWHNEGHGPLVPTYPFNNNNNTHTGQSVSWMDSGTSGVLLKQLLSTSLGSTAHPQWRVRVRHHPATALDGRAFGKWHMQGVHDMQVPSIKTEFGTCGVLPVELLSFHVNCAGGAARLDWTTATERDCAGFVVERSYDTQTWSQLAVVACAGNSQSPRSYSFNDAAPMTSTTYYRLKQMDTDGAVNVLPTMTTEPCALTAGSIMVWPNPTSDVLHVDHTNISGLSEGVVIEVFDATGRQVASLPATHDAGTTRISMAGMAPGVYALVARDPDGAPLGHARVLRK